jgi:hypothetical protein
MLLSQYHNPALRMTLALCNAICDDRFTLADRRISMFRRRSFLHPPPMAECLRGRQAAFFCNAAVLRRKRGPAAV